MIIGRQVEKKREKLEEEMGTLNKSWKNFAELSKRKARKREVHPEKTVNALYRPISSNDLTGADRAGI